MVGTAAGLGVDEVVGCANAVIGVAHSNRIKDVLEILRGEKPAKEICVVIDIGELRSAPHVLTRCHPDKTETSGKSKMFH